MKIQVHFFLELHHMQSCFLAINLTQDLYISVYIYRCINNFKFCVYFQMYVYNLYGGIDVAHSIGKMLFRLHVYIFVWKRG